MGFFDFLKKPKTEPEVKTLSLKEAAALLDEKFEEIKKRVNDKVVWKKNEISGEKAKLNSNLTVLENAELRNKDIPERARHLMEGNRQIYLKKVNTLLEKIVLPEDPHELLVFLEDLDKKIDLFDKGITKSHNIMEEFFVEKASVIAAGVKNLDKLLKELKQLVEKSDLKKIKELKNKLLSVTDSSCKKEECEQKLNSLSRETKSLGGKIKEQESKINELKKSTRYQDILLLIESKKNLEKELNEIDSKIKHVFSEIEPALKKYENLSENKLLEKYLQDPLSTLLGDVEFEILTIIEATKKAIIKNEITLKDRKKDRIMNELFSLNKDFFQELINKKTELTEALSEKVSQIENSQILKDLAELEKSLGQEKISLQEKISESEKTKKLRETSNSSDLIVSLENDFKEKLNLEVKIV
ncbi:MAG: hypothetical protein KKD18_03875 [Nanoarchaeota archaeon]|nr:hypothetical protein [Nanoarchaeota archaeon]MBU0977530.1 hypothetical protein [Nanoarchaeota archaeon]